MNLLLLFREKIAIRDFVYRFLASSVSVCTIHGEIRPIEVKKVPLYQGRYNYQVLYISGVVLAMSLSHNSSVMEVAQAIAGHLSHNCDNLLNVVVVPPGWIHIHLTDFTLAAWLQTVTLDGFDVPELDFSREQDLSVIFKIQYVHARCVSLLRTADRENLIKLIYTNSGNVLSAESLPWLNGNNQLYLHHHDERFLLHQLIKMVDILFDNDCKHYKSMNWLEAGYKLCQAWEKFWSSCRIWGEVKTDTVELSQSRLGLLIVTHLVLKSLLERRLGVVAPLEL
ncbi:DALR anticodon-binding domain-containing protein [Anabaena sp. FACHB-1237]|uniref:DALR anticodon-binding domain-containing protein n=1 Tax=Anabaena sp. FACHB-1237 TaxID=2692769 RepID=UPI0028C4E279|nr:DALR anticodon-binding domain-containing protein [Anabaena sp. FACHB-1237]